MVFISYGLLKVRNWKGEKNKTGRGKEYERKERETEQGREKA